MRSFSPIFFVHLMDYIGVALCKCYATFIIFNCFVTKLCKLDLQEKDFTASYLKKLDAKETGLSESNRETMRFLLRDLFLAGIVVAVERYLLFLNHTAMAD